MDQKYSIFGANDKETPQETLARIVLGVGRESSSKEIRKIDPTCMEAIFKAKKKKELVHGGFRGLGKKIAGFLTMS